MTVQDAEWYRRQNADIAPDLDQLVAKAAESAAWKGTRVDALGADFSNYSGTIRINQAVSAAGLGLQLAIIQTLTDPPAPYPPSSTQFQIAAFLEASVPVDVYLYGWLDGNDIEMQNALLLLANFPIRRLWLDIEDVTTGVGFTPQKRVARYDSIFEWLKGVNTLLPPGRYTAKWYFDQGYLNAIDCQHWANDPLWVNQADGVRDTAKFTQFGPFTRCAIKQYLTGQVFGGIQSVDLNAVSEDEMQAGKVPADYQNKFGCGEYDWQCVTDNLEGIISSLQKQVEAGQVSTAPNAAEATVEQILQILKTAGY